MDSSSLSHQFRKILLDLQSSSSSNPVSNTLQDAPPSYQSAINTYDEVDNDVLDGNDDTLRTDTIIIDATTHVNGTGNVVNADTGALGARLAAALTTVLKTRTENCSEVESPTKQGPQRPIRVHVSCGIKVVGHRNIVGSVRAQLPQQPQPSQKRKAESLNAELNETAETKRQATGKGTETC